MTTTIRKLVAGVIFPLTLAFGSYADAASDTWLPASGDWDVGANWSSGSSPYHEAMPYDDAIIDNGRTAFVSGTDLGGAGSVYVGYSGTGNLTINGGGITGMGYLGYNDGSSGTMVVSSGTWNGNLVVGEYGSGNLNISGGTVTSGTSCTLGVGVGSIGTATITNGKWNPSFLIVGGSGQGVVNINGGSVTSDSSYIGKNAGSNGTVTVTSGTWSNVGDLYYPGQLYVGYSGTGTLNLTGNSSITISIVHGGGTLTIAYQAGSTGILNLGQGGAAGALNATIVTGGTGRATVNFNHSGNYTFTPQLTGRLSVNKYGSGTTTLTNANTYSGATTIYEGELDVNGSLGPSTPMTVAEGAILGGNGFCGNGSVKVDGILKGTLKTGKLIGSGLISPGNSPGILTSTSVDPIGGLSFAFEFTLTNTNPIYSNALASGNDILRFTGASPFASNLTTSNLISIYLNRAIIGDTYLGGFFTGLTDVQLEAAIQNAKFAFFVEDDANGTITFNGKKYDSLDASLIAVGAIQVNGANFASGTVNGSEMQLTVVPEPTTWMMLVTGTGLLIFSQWISRSKNHQNLV